MPLMGITVLSKAKTLALKTAFSLWWGVQYTAFALGVASGMNEFSGAPASG